MGLCYYFLPDPGEVLKGYCMRDPLRETDAHPPMRYWMCHSYLVSPPEDEASTQKVSGADCKEPSACTSFRRDNGFF